MANQLELTQRPFIELQIEALVEENRIQQKRAGKFIAELTKRILAIDRIDFEKCLRKTFRLPTICRPNAVSGDYPRSTKFYPPKQVEIIGGFKTSTAIQKCRYIDLAVCIPSQTFSPKDLKNQRYHHKRALYLRQLAELLNSILGNGLIEKLEFRHFMGDVLKPVLLITPKDSKLKETCTFQLFAYPDPESPLKFSLLKPDHGNLAPKWFFENYHFKQDTEMKDEVRIFLNGESDMCASPIYNSGILFDAEMVSNSNILAGQLGSQTSIIEALLLTKIWLFQRGLHHHFSFIISMFVAYLQTKQIVHQNMSSYQIFKNIVKSLTNSDWSGEGLSYFEDSQDNLPSFKSVFPVVFLSPSGNFNMCYNISSDLYRRLKHEAGLASNLCDTNSSEIFELLFLKQVDFYTKFDAFVHLPKCTKKLPLSLDYLRRFMDHACYTPIVMAEPIIDLARRALGDRITLIQQNTSHLQIDKKWNFKSIAHDPCNVEQTLTLGLLLDPENSLRIIDVGPQADTPEAEDFRQFWDPKSQLRLQNGVISETVVWHVKSFSQRRAIIKYIFDHTMKKADLHNVIVHYNLLERFIKLDNVFFQWRDESTTNDESTTKGDQSDEENTTDANGKVQLKRPLRACEGRQVQQTKKRKQIQDQSGDDPEKHNVNVKRQGGKLNEAMKGNCKPVGVGEEIFQRALRSYNELNRVLRSIANMKHAITGVQPTSQYLRSSAVFPPLPVNLQCKNRSLKRSKGVTMFPDHFNQYSRILHLDPIEIMITLDSTGKWPNELEAMEAAKLEYLIRLAEVLKDKGYCIKLGVNYLDLLNGQFVFRLRIKCQKEMGLLASACSKPEFQRRRLELEVGPRVHAALDQLYREMPAFGLTCRLVKRWLSCHLMTDLVSELAIELLVAHCFIRPEPNGVPASSASGFMRFLKLLALHDWANLPLVINFDGQLKMDEAQRLKESMLEERAKYPPMVICTPFDKDICPWTRQSPSAIELDLLCRICSKAMNYYERNILANQDLGSGECLKALFLPNFKVYHLIVKLKRSVVQNFFMSINQPKEFELRGREPSGNSPSATNVMPIVGLNIIEQFVALLRRNFHQLAIFYYDKYGQRLIGVRLTAKAEQDPNFELSALVRDIKRVGAKMVDSVVEVKRGKPVTCNEECNQSYEEMDLK